MARRPVALSFAPVPSVVRLDDPVTIVAVARIDDDGPSGAERGLTLALTDERGTRLGLATTDAEGRAVFVLDSTRLGPPGKGELRVAFDGAADLSKAQHAASVERRASVVLSCPEASSGALPAADAEEGAPFTVLARTRAGAVVPTGSVEALVDQTVVGAATIEAGTAKLVVGAPSVSRERTVRLRRVTLPMRPGTPLGKSSRWRCRSTRRAPFGICRSCSRASASSHGLPWASPAHQARVRRDRHFRHHPRVGGRGSDRRLALDAERARGVERARRRRARRDPDRRSHRHAGAAVLLGMSSAGVTQTNAAGRFELRVEQVAEGDVLAVEAPLHATLRKPVPAFGELQVALVLPGEGSSTSSWRGPAPAGAPWIKRLSRPRVTSARRRGDERVSNDGQARSEGGVRRRRRRRRR